MPAAIVQLAFIISSGFQAIYCDFQAFAGQVLDTDGNPMEGLYAAGNCSGGFYGAIEYSLDTMGLSIGRCVTFGYLAGKDVAAL